MTRELRILSHAHLDFAEIVDWLAKNSVAGAERWIAAFDTALTDIAQHPDHSPLAPEDEFTDIEVREFFFRTKRGHRYRILFTLIDEEIRVLRIRSPGQDLLTDGELRS